MLHPLFGMQRFIHMRRVAINHARSRITPNDNCPGPIFGKEIVSLNNIKRILYHPPDNLMIEYIGDPKPIKLTNMNEKVYNMIVSELKKTGGSMIVYDDKYNFSVDSGDEGAGTGGGHRYDPLPSCPP